MKLKLKQQDQNTSPSGALFAPDAVSSAPECRSSTPALAEESGATPGSSSSNSRTDLRMGSFLWMSSGRGLNESLLIVPTTPAAAATSSHLRPPPPRPTTRPHRLAQGSERTSSSGPGETLGPRRPSGRAGRAGPREPRGMPRSGG